jgi:hypothetical protein
MAMPPIIVVELFPNHRCRCRGCSFISLPQADLLLAAFTFVAFVMIFEAGQTMDRTTPPSTRSAAPLVADARGLQT